MAKATWIVAVMLVAWVALLLVTGTPGVIEFAITLALFIALFVLVFARVGQAFRRRPVQH